MIGTCPKELINVPHCYKCESKKELMVARTRKEGAKTWITRICRKCQRERINARNRKRV